MDSKKKFFSSWFLLNVYKMGFWHSKVLRADEKDDANQEKEVIRYFDRWWHKSNEQKLKNLVIMSIAKNKDDCAINALRYMHVLPKHTLCEMTQEDLKLLQMYIFVFTRLGINIEDTYEANVKNIFDDYAKNQLYNQSSMDMVNKCGGVYATYIGQQSLMPLFDAYAIREINHSEREDHS